MQEHAAPAPLFGVLQEDMIVVESPVGGDARCLLHLEAALHSPAPRRILVQSIIADPFKVE